MACVKEVLNKFLMKDKGKGKKGTIHGNSLKLWYFVLLAFLILVAMHGMLNTQGKSENINFLENI